MSKNTVIVVVVLLLLAVGAFGAWLWMSSQKIDDANANIVAGNSNTTNTANANSNTANANATSTIRVAPTAAPEPLESWNTSWRTGTVYLSTLPATLTEGESACAAQAQPNGCYGELAVGFRDAASCGKIAPLPEGTLSLTTYEEDLQGCFEAFGQEYGVFDCAMYSDQATRDQCYLVFAANPHIESDVQTRDCTLIVDPSVATQCASAVTAQNELDDAVSEFSNQSQALVDKLEIIMAMFCYLKDNANAVSVIGAGTIHDEIQGEVQLMTASDCTDIAAEGITQAGLDLAVDADDDGLPLVLEKYYDTDDAAADSDGDGYDDLEELNNNFNPNGPGTLDGS